MLLRAPPRVSLFLLFSVGGVGGGLGASAGARRRRLLVLRLGEFCAALARSARLVCLLPFAVLVVAELAGGGMVSARLRVFRRCSFVLASGGGDFLRFLVGVEVSWLRFRTISVGCVKVFFRPLSAVLTVADCLLVGVGALVCEGEFHLSGGWLYRAVDLAGIVGFVFRPCSRR
jgi:hypothetical protein